MHGKMFFEATIEIRGIDRHGLLRDVAEVISSQLNIDMRKLVISGDEGVFDGTIELRVHDRNETQQIIDKLKDIDGIHEVQRIL